MNSDSTLQQLVYLATARKLIDGIVGADGWILVYMDGGEICVPEAHAPAFLRGLLEYVPATAELPEARTYRSRSAATR